MGIHRRKYTKDFKIEMVESALKGRSILELAKENDIYPGLITRWKSQYLDCKFHGTSASDTELRKLKLKICELEQDLWESSTLGKLPFKKRKRVCNCQEKRYFIHNNRSQFGSISEGCRLIDISRLTYYCRPKDNFLKKKLDSDPANAIEKIAY